MTDLSSSLDWHRQVFTFNFILGYTYVKTYTNDIILIVTVYFLSLFFSFVITVVKIGPTFHATADKPCFTPSDRMCSMYPSAAR